MTDIGLIDDMLIVKKEEYCKKIGQHVVKLREAKGWTQSDLARACGKDRQAIEKIENGKVNPTAFSLLEVATALGLPHTEMLNFRFNPKK